MNPCSFFETYLVPSSVNARIKKSVHLFWGGILLLVFSFFYLKPVEHLLSDGVLLVQVHGGAVKPSPVTPDCRPGLPCMRDALETLLLAFCDWCWLTHHHADICFTLFPSIPWSSPEKSKGPWAYFHACMKIYISASWPPSCRSRRR